MEKYSGFTRDDFLDDDFFIEQVKNPYGAAARRWEAWLAQKPVNEKDYLDALFMLKGFLSVERLEPSVFYTDALLTSIEERISINERKRRTKQWLRWSCGTVAASVLLFIGVFWYGQSVITVYTGNGELRSLVLPDSSWVHLNANSSIRYHRAWKWRDKREVWTTGEVLMEVKHLNKDASHIRENERFRAYSGDLLVEVLGTKFNVKNRRDETSVSLIEGKVRVSKVGDEGYARVLQPGELIRYKQGAFGKTEATALQAAAPETWVNRELLTRNMSVADIIQEYTVLYGKELILNDSSLLEKRVDGRLSLRSEESIVYALANILDANIRYRKDTVYLDVKKKSKEKLNNK